MIKMAKKFVFDDEIENHENKYDNEEFPYETFSSQPDSIVDREPHQEPIYHKEHQNEDFISQQDSNQKTSFQQDNQDNDEKTDNKTKKAKPKTKKKVKKRTKRKTKQQTKVVKEKKTHSFLGKFFLFIIITLIIAVLCVGGYIGYRYYIQQQNEIENLQQQINEQSQDQYSQNTNESSQSSVPQTDNTQDNNNQEDSQNSSDDTSTPDTNEETTPPISNENNESLQGTTPESQQ